MLLEVKCESNMNAFVKEMTGHGNVDNASVQKPLCVVVRET